MKIHEYQGKEILKSYSIPIQDGYVLDSNDSAKSTIAKVQQDFSCEAVVVKAQIHAGGRGKGGGIKFCDSTDKAIDAVSSMLGSKIVTHQTGPDGQEVRKIMVTEALDIKNEYYVGLTIDRNKESVVFMVSTEGGVDIETVAAETPEKIIKVWIDPLLGIRSFHVRKLVSGLGLSGGQGKEAAAIFRNLYSCFVRTDASLIEINPLVETDDSKIIALDAKFNFDDNGLYRQKEINDMRDENEEDPTEVEAKKYNLNYIKLDGNVGCMVNGAGLAMATMDLIKLTGGDPANFLDVGGAASVDTIKNGFKIILSDKNVKCVLINIFGGIVRCDRVANGVVQAVKDLGLDIPVVVRLEGTNSDIAKDILEESGVDIVSASTFIDAAQKSVDIVN